MKRSWVISILSLSVILIACTASTVWAENLGKEASLVGITELKVVIGISEDVTGTGLTEEDIRTIVELKLRLADKPWGPVSVYANGSRPATPRQVLLR